METQFELILLLLAIAAGVTAFAKKLNLPYPIALVIVGAVIGMVPIQELGEMKTFFAEDEVFRFAIISIFLPTLLGEATLKLPFSHLNENRLQILLLAFIGTMVAFLATTWLSGQFLSLPLQAALVFAALMAPTDPISVLSIFKNIGVDYKLSVTMEGESLINDGLAVVLFSIAAYELHTYLDAGSTGFVLVLLEFIKVVFGGLMIGGALSYIFSHLTRLFDDYPLEIVFSMLLFYGSYFIAEAFHASGVIAVVIAGIIFGNYGKKIGMTPTTSLNIKTFWDVASLIANSLVFLLVGLEITNFSFADQWYYILGAIIIVLLSRSASVYLSVGFLRNIPWTWKHVFNWGGLKGSLSLALAFSLPSSFPMRDEILIFAFGVVMFSLIIQGLTIKPLVLWLGVKTEKRNVEEFERLFSLIYRNISGQNRLNELTQNGMISSVTINPLLDNYRKRLKKLNRELTQLYEKNPELYNEQIEKASKEALYAEHAAIDHLSSHHLISGNMTDKQRGQVVDLLQQEETRLHLTERNDNEE
jgi:CPA1 family monovalent cation:H+ antiporter